MDMEKLAQFRNRAMNLSDSSPVTEYKGLATLLGELYKEELPETLSGSGLTTERSNVDTDVAALVAEFDANTQGVNK